MHSYGIENVPRDDSEAEAEITRRLEAVRDLSARMSEEQRKELLLRSTQTLAPTTELALKAELAALRPSR